MMSSSRAHANAKSPSINRMKTDGKSDDLQFPGMRHRVDWGRLLPRIAEDTRLPWNRHADRQPWLRYFLTALKQQKDRLQERIDRERLLFGNLPELSARILEIARERGRVSVADAVLVTGASRNTLKGHFRTLVEAGHLNRHGAGRGSWYSPA